MLEPRVTETGDMKFPAVNKHLELESSSLLPELRDTGMPS